MKKKINLKQRNLHAINAQFRKAGAMKDSKEKEEKVGKNRKLWKNIIDDDGWMTEHITDTHTTFYGDEKYCMYDEQQYYTQKEMEEILKEIDFQMEDLDTYHVVFEKGIDRGLSIAKKIILKKMEKKC